VESSDHKAEIVTERDMVRITPELHFLIGERSKLEAGLTHTALHELVLAGYCEMCQNYSSRPRNVNSIWIREDCIGR
jgi:hypothetical protein